MRKEPLIIAIDGPSGAGKTGIARQAAKCLEGFAYLDTGAVYRAMAYAMLDRGLTAQNIRTDRGACLDAVGKAVIRIRYGASGTQLMELNKITVPDQELRTPEMSEAASAISADPIMRLFARHIIENRPYTAGTVAEGRDTGTALFPNAALKFYLYATALERARRRALQLYGEASKGTVAKVQQDLDIRDTRDITRQDDPLRCARGAIWIDTGSLSEQQVLDIILGAARAVMDPDAVPLA